MQQNQLLDHLNMAEAHVRRGQRLVLRQRELITKLSRGGHDVTAAMALLQQLEDSQSLHVADCTRLRDELGLPT
jgi:hypothetical protein